MRVTYCAKCLLNISISRSRSTSVFRPNYIVSEQDMKKCEKLNETGEKIRYFTDLEVDHKIDNNINSKKAPGIAEIIPGILKELPKKAIIF